MTAILKYPRRDSRGFTLLEVMISVGILALVLVALLGLRNRAIGLNDYARNLTIATILAKEKIERLELEGPLQFGEIAGNFEGDYSPFQWRQRVSPTSYADVKELTVSVSWKEGRREKVVEVTTYLVE